MRLFKKIVCSFVAIVCAAALAVGMTGCSQKAVSGAVETIGDITVFVPDGLEGEMYNDDGKRLPNVIMLTGAEGAILIHADANISDEYVNKNKEQNFGWDVDKTIGSVTWTGYSCNSGRTDVVATVNGTDYWVSMNKLTLDSASTQAILKSLAE